MRRIAFFCGLLAVTAGGVVALAAGQSPTIDLATADPAVVPAPAFDEPEISAASAARVADPVEDHEAEPEPSTATPATEDDPAVEAHTEEPGPADHLSVEEPAPTPEVVAVVTTTTAPPTTTTAAPVVTVAFTATQAYGSCGEDVPYDIFSGTATPGTRVTISSPYGSGSTVAGGDGHWEKTVEFPTAPRNEVFTVTASGLGGSATLQFFATGAEHA